MRYAVFALVLLSGTAAYATGASSVHPDLRLQTPPYSTAARLQLGTRWDAYNRIQTELLGLREEGLKLRDADGGTLTGEHRDYLQVKLNAILAEQKNLR